MGFSSRGRYAVEALLYLSISAKKGSFLTVKAISSALHVPEDALERIFFILCHKGMLVAAPGANAGYALAQPLNEKSVAAAVHAVEGSSSTSVHPYF